jgi:hypothetical protein
MFIDPRFKGKTALPSDIGVNLLIAGVIGGWADPLDPTEAEMEAAPEIFTKMLENARFVWTDSTQLEQAWAAGDVGISYVYGSASRRMPGEGMPIIVVEPLLTWMCGLSVSANGAGSEDQAYDYINAMLDPRSGVDLRASTGEESQALPALVRSPGRPRLSGIRRGRKDGKYKNGGGNNLRITSPRRLAAGPFICGRRWLRGIHACFAESPGKCRLRQYPLEYLVHLEFRGSRGHHKAGKSRRGGDPWRRHIRYT